MLNFLVANITKDKKSTICALCEQMKISGVFKAEQFLEWEENQFKDVIKRYGITKDDFVIDVSYNIKDNLINQKYNWLPKFMLTKEAIEYYNTKLLYVTTIRDRYYQIFLQDTDWDEAYYDKGLDTFMSMDAYIYDYVEKHLKGSSFKNDLEFNKIREKLSLSLFDIKKMFSTK